MNTVELEFQIHGLCYQTINLYHSCDLTPAQVVDGLAQGEIVTSCGGTKLLYKIHEKGGLIPIGEVVAQTFQCEYDEFMDNA